VISGQSAGRTHRSVAPLFTQKWEQLQFQNAGLVERRLTCLTASAARLSSLMMASFDFKRLSQKAVGAGRNRSIVPLPDQDLSASDGESWGIF
jgi:hypothetical protein